MPAPRPLWQRYAAVILYLVAGFALVQALAITAGPFLGMSQSEDKTMPFRVLLYGVLFQIIGFLLPAGLLLRFTGGGIFSFRRVSSGDILLACGLTFASVVFFSLLYHLLRVETSQLAFLDPRQIYENRGLFLVLTGLIVPAYEEWIFRGLIFGILVTQVTDRKSVLVAAFFTALVFTASHIEGAHSLSSLPPILVMALLFQYVTWKTRSIWPSVAGHAMQNLLAALLLIAKAGEQVARQ